MRAWLFSDLHLEYGRKFKPAVPTDADMLICAGDILVKGIAPSIQWLGSILPRTLPIVFVAGNHEYWRSSMTDALSAGRDAARQFPNIHLLENEAVDIEDVHFVGGTLWTDFRLRGLDAEVEMWRASELMRDYKKIKWSKIPYSKFKPIHAFRAHMETRRFIEAELKRSSGRKTVVVTHHAPSIRSIPIEDRHDPVTAAYASDLEQSILTGRPTVWVHGHVHKRSDYAIGATRIVCNPLGYPGEFTGFGRALTIEI